MSVTMQELEAQPPGTPVLVDGVEWRKVDNGLERDGTALRLMHFTGYIQAGRVECSGLWPNGRWYHYGHSLRLVTGREDGHVKALGWNGANTTPEFFTWPESTAPGRWRLFPMQSETEWHQRIRALHQTMVAQAPAVPELLVESLRAYAVDAEDAEFDALLAEYGIVARVATHHVTMVTLSGSSVWVPTEAQAKGWLGTGCEVTGIDDSVLVSWRRTVQVTRSGFGCTCNEIDRSMVEQYVPAHADVWDFDVECAVQSTE